MITIVIIDDEANAIENLVWEFSNYQSSVKIINTFTNPEEAIIYLKNNEVDAVFLDINMPKIDGFTFLENLPERKFAVIITTAYNQFGIEAIKHQCLDYLQKPIDADDIKQVIAKLEKYKKEHIALDAFEQILINAANSKDSNKKITINADGKIFFLKPDDILYCESDGNYCTVFLENGKKILISQKIKNIEEKLTEDFYRVHNSYVININKVTEYLKSEGYVVLNNQKKIPVSRQKKSSFLDMF